VGPEQVLTVDCMVQFKITYTINVSENKKLCPFEARLNPEWRCKEWDEDRTETFNFYGFDPLTNKKDLTSHVINLDSSGEFLTRIRGIHKTYISKVEFTTNFGREYTIGHDYPVEDQDVDDFGL